MAKQASSSMTRLQRRWSEKLTNEKFQRRSTAIHEAAHAVVAHVMGERVELLTISQRITDTLGCKVRHGNCRIGYTVRRGKSDPISMAVVSLAGHEAEVIMCGRPIQFLPAGDYKDLLKLGCSERNANVVGWMARKFIRANAKAIRRVAWLLNERGVMTRKQFLKAFEFGSRGETTEP